MPPIYDAKFAETMAKYYIDLVCKYYPDHPYTPPPTSKPSKPPTLDESLAKLADNIDKLELVVKRLVAKRLTASSPVNKIKNVITQNTPTSIIPMSSITPPLNNEEQDKTKASNPTHNMVQVHPGNSFKPCGTGLRIISATNPSTNYRSTQNQSVGLRLQCLATTDIQAYCQRGLCFCCPKMSLVCHQCCPPKLVFLRIEPKPPWKPRDTRDNAMSLEDKTRF
ncbi:hypothetical protein Tco_1421888 [Tanacetum coccineum]